MGKRSGNGFVAHKATLVSALSRALSERVMLLDYTIGRKGLLGYLKALAGSNIVKVTGIGSTYYLKPLVSVSLRPASTTVSGNSLDYVAPAERLQVGKEAFTPYGKVNQHYPFG